MLQLTLTLILILSFAKVDGRPTCESPWKEFKGKCFLFSTVRQSYHEAQKTCYGQGGFLTSIRNGEDFRFISKVIQTFGAHYSTQGWFIGMHQINITGSTSFRWLDGSVANFQNWMSSQPNNIYEECVMMDGTSGLRWRDELCTKRSFFVCRREKGQMECYEGDLNGNPEYDVSVTGCVEQCRGQGYSLAAVSDDKCGCYNNMDSSKFKPKQRTKCNALCAGQHCGANGHVAVYNIKSYNEVAATCEDLSNVGINKPNTYILQKDVKGKGNNIEVGPGTSCFSGTSSLVSFQEIRITEPISNKVGGTGKPVRATNLRPKVTVSWVPVHAHHMRAEHRGRRKINCRILQRETSSASVPVEELPVQPEPEVNADPASTVPDMKYTTLPDFAGTRPRTLNEVPARMPSTSIPSSALPSTQGNPETQFTQITSSDHNTLNEVPAGMPSTSIPSSALPSTQGNLETQSTQITSPDYRTNPFTATEASSPPVARITERDVAHALPSTKYETVLDTDFSTTLAPLETAPDLSLGETSGTTAHVMTEALALTSLKTDSTGSPTSPDKPNTKSYSETDSATPTRSENPKRDTNYPGRFPTHSTSLSVPNNYPDSDTMPNTHIHSVTNKYGTTFRQVPVSTVSQSNPVISIPQTSPYGPPYNRQPSSFSHPSSISAKNPSTRPENGMKSETVTISFTDEVTQKPCVDCQRETQWNKAGFGFKRRGNFGENCKASVVSIGLAVLFCFFRFQIL